MRLKVTCMGCLADMGGSALENELKHYEVDVRDDFLITFVCEKGHQNNLLFQSHRFEVLSLLGAHAFRDGYYRDAVSSFASCLERFYEFYIKLICYDNDIDIDKVAQAWKHVSSQSERQLGAFVYLYLIHNNETPLLLISKLIEFRNSVIHKGIFPSRKDTANYINGVMDFVNPIIVDLLNTMQTSVQAMQDTRRIEIRESTKHLENTYVLAQPYPISLSFRSAPIYSIEFHNIESYIQNPSVQIHIG